MRFPLQPFGQLDRLSQALEDSGEDLQSILAVLVEDLRAAVPSFTGLLLTIPIDDEQVTITAVDPTAARASMLLPLHLITDLPSPTDLVFYAADTGAFVELAADTRTMYGLDGQVELDRHLPAPIADGGAPIVIDGTLQRSSMDQAIGVLLDRGLSPEQARAELASRAAAAKIPPLQIAHEILDRLDGPAGRRHRRKFPDLPTRQPGTAQRPDTFAAALAELALTIKDEGVKGEDHAMTVIIEGAVAIITGAQHAAVVVPAGPRQLAARAAHGDLPPVLMDLQNTLGEGPCLQAVQQTAQVLVPNLATDDRWPRFSTAAVRSGAASMLCTPMTVPDTTVGTLTLVSDQPHAFDAEAASLAAVFAAHATVALVGVNQQRNLAAMADHRDLIGQAKGVLMERHQMTADQAFQLLVRSSQTTNLKLREVCQRLAATGQLPQPPLS